VPSAVRYILRLRIFSYISLILFTSCLYFLEKLFTLPYEFGDIPYISPAISFIMLNKNTSGSVLLVSSVVLLILSMIYSGLDFFQPSIPPQLFGGIYHFVRFINH
jgi:hypothetical protein